MSITCPECLSTFQLLREDRLSRDRQLARTEAAVIGVEPIGAGGCAEAIVYEPHPHFLVRIRIQKDTAAENDRVEAGVSSRI